MRKIRFGLTGGYLAVIIVLLLTINFTLGFVLIKQSGDSIISLLQERMLDISNTAADAIDGDVLGKLRAEDADTPEYRKIFDTLELFRKNIDLQYIYCVRDAGGKRFVFTIDPSPVTPGIFGEAVVYTDALYRASLGAAAVDQKPYVDAWGKFYSAYSPVFDSNGKVAGIVAVDFSADWYDEQILGFVRTISITCFLSLMIGALVVFAATGRLRHKFRYLYVQLNILAENVEELIHEISNRSYKKVRSAYADENTNETFAENIQIGFDEISALDEKIISMQKKLRDYITLAHSQAYTDALTGVGNKTAYLDLTRHLDRMIQEGIAVFSVAVFDMNGLKTINDNYGHECGDLALIDAANVLSSVFGSDNLYRIGGDEFITVVKHDLGEMQMFFNAIDDKLVEINRTPNAYKFPLAIAKGAAVFTSGRDKEFREVFKRADDNMYANKAKYYNRYGRGKNYVI